jgi:hypothetical protein
MTKLTFFERLAVRVINVQTGTAAHGRLVSERWEAAGELSDAYRPIAEARAEKRIDTILQKDAANRCNFLAKMEQELAAA